MGAVWTRTTGNRRGPVRGAARPRPAPRRPRMRNDRIPARKGEPMDWKLELVSIPVTDVDRAKAFYVEQAGFVADHDHVDLRRASVRPADAARIGVLDHAGDRDHGCATRLGAGAARRRGRGGGPHRACRSWCGRRRGAGVPVGLVRLLRRPGREPLGGAAAAGLTGRARVEARLTSSRSCPAVSSGCSA